MKKGISLCLGLIFFLGLIAVQEVAVAYNTGYDRFRHLLSDTEWRMLTQYNIGFSKMIRDAAGGTIGRLSYDGQRLSWIVYSSDLPFTGESYDYNKDRPDQSKGWYHSMDFIRDGATVTATLSYRLGEDGKAYLDTISYADYTGSTYTVSIKGGPGVGITNPTEGLIKAILIAVTSGNPTATISIGDGKTVTAELTGVYFSGADFLESDLNRDGKLGDGILAKLDRLGVSQGVIKTGEVAVIRWMFGQWDNVDEFRAAMRDLPGSATWDRATWQNFFNEFKKQVEALATGTAQRLSFRFPPETGVEYEIWFVNENVKIKKKTDADATAKTYTTFVSWMRDKLGAQIPQFYTWTATDWNRFRDFVNALPENTPRPFTLANGTVINLRLKEEGTTNTYFLEIEAKDKDGHVVWQSISGGVALTRAAIIKNSVDTFKQFLKDNGFSPDWTTAMWQQLYGALFGRADKWNSNEEFPVEITIDISGNKIAVTKFAFKFTEYDATTGVFKINVKKPNGQWEIVGQVTGVKYEKGTGYLKTGPGENERVPLDQVTAADLRKAQLFVIEDMIKLAFDYYVTAAGEAAKVDVADGTTNPPTHVNILQDLNSFKAGIKSSPWYTQGSAAFKAAIDALTDAQWRELYDKVMLFYDADPNNPTMGASGGNPNNAGWAGTIFTIGGLQLTFENEGTITRDGKTYQKLGIWMRANTGTERWYAVRHIGADDRPIPTPLVGITIDLFDKVVTSYTVYGRLSQTTVDNLMDPHEMGRAQQNNDWERILWGDPAVSGILRRVGNEWRMDVGVWSNASGVHVDWYWYNNVATTAQRADVDAARRVFGDRVSFYNENGSQVALTVVLAGFNFTGYENRFVTAWGAGNDIGHELNRIIQIVGLGRGDYEWHPFDL